MSKRIRNSDPGAMRRSRRLRLNMTDMERKLWQALRAKALGFRFRREYPVGSYALDFFCYEARLCVEVDGEFHDRQPSRDARRDAWLARRGITTRRFRTVDIIENLDGALETIFAVCCERTGRNPFAPPPQPSPAERGRG